MDMAFNSAAPKSLSVVIPMYQEAGNADRMLARVHEGLAGYPGPWELICIDDGSTDGTGQLLQAGAKQYGSHVRVIRMRRNFGQTAAMQAGIDTARGELVATLDGDLQNDPADIPRMVAELEQRDLDLLQGWRRHRQDGVLRRLPSWLANGLIARVTGVRLHDYGCSLKIYRREVITQVRLFGEMHRFIPVWVASVTAPERIGETEVKHYARQAGASKYGMSRTFRVVLDLLAVFFFLKYRARPGHFFGSIGLVFGGVSALLMAYLAVVKFGLHQDIGDRPLFFIAILMAVASVQLLTTGVLAEMLSRTFFNSSTTPAHSVMAADDVQTAGWYTLGQGAGTTLRRQERV
jgi:glycosyltransferase involved in cell wall biosynthesis